MPSVAEILRSRKTTGFSVEVLPPLKGKGISRLFADLDKLTQFKPLFVNITTHHSEPVYQPAEGGNLRKVFVRKRPGTVAVAAAIHHRYGIPTVPHIICRGFSPEETEYVLIDLNFLGIKDLFLLRGDTDKEVLVPVSESHAHATDLIGQVLDFNRGVMLDGQGVDTPEHPFSFGVAGYPEKHAEAPNMKTDIDWLKRKVDLGAEYVITQLFFGNEHFYRFVDTARAAGIDVPIIPGLKPISRKAQVNVLPRIFNTEIPEQLVESISAATDDEVKKIGRDWLLAQAADLKEHGVPCVHFYSLGAVDTVCSVAQELYG
ncbi:MAG: methylenetetrahydrofolate reductase [Bacteroidales bacterium]|nr:methylenetetrahydrofolate reductase [Bacteroidales bacterium]